MARPWPCPDCTLLNAPDVEFCKACRGARPVAIASCATDKKHGPSSRPSPAPKASKKGLDAKSTLQEIELILGGNYGNHRSPARDIVSLKRKECSAPVVAAKGYPWGLQWAEDVAGSLHCLDSQLLPKLSKVAAFDVDWTLVKPKSGAKFASNRADWMWLLPCVPLALRALHEAGYAIVVFTNQGGIEKKRVRASDVTGKILDMCKEVGVPIRAFVAGAINQYRKPHAAMWQRMVERCGKLEGLEPGTSIYIGDAAGRAAVRGVQRKDFSCTDRAFALNVGADFATPEAFFMEKTEPSFSWGKRCVDPRMLIKSLSASTSARAKVIRTLVKSLSTKQEMVILCGPPGAGKSRIATTHLAKYTRINRDTLRTKARCLKAAKLALANGESVVLDNTFPSSKSRAEYVTLARRVGVRVVCWHLTTNRATAEHLNFVREAMTKGRRRRVPAIAFNVFYKHFESPDAVREGLDDVRQVPFALEFDTTSAAGANAMRLFLERSG